MLFEMICGVFIGLNLCLFFHCGSFLNLLNAILIFVVVVLHAITEEF